jgi:hypothetical protein
VIRHRLRFLLQEFDLPAGITLLGRSSECHITIEDPLVSRTHARIERDADSVTLRDEGSRNGVRVNGHAISGTHTLTHGDRIRIGTQELVFTKVNLGERTGKTTGFLRHCAKCRIPYPEESKNCPNCGAQEFLEEDTITGKQQDQRTWQLKLYAEVLERGLAMSRFEDVERIWTRAAAEVDERLRGRSETGVATLTIEEPLLRSLLLTTLRLSVALKNVMWACWAIRVVRQAYLVPDHAFMGTLPEVLAAFPLECSEAVRELGAFLGESELEGARDCDLALQQLIASFPENSPSDGPQGLG